MSNWIFQDQIDNTAGVVNKESEEKIIHRSGPQTRREKVILDTNRDNDLTSTMLLVNRLIIIVVQLDFLGQPILPDARPLRV